MRLLGSVSTFGAVVCSATFFAPTITAGASGNAPYPPDGIPMRLEIDVTATRYLVGENFPITVRIVNPNAYDVYLRGFQFGPLEPHMEIAFPEQEEFEDFSLGGIINALGGPPVLVPARGKKEHRRLIYSGTKLNKGHWLLMLAGEYRIRLKDSVGAVTLDDPPRYMKVDWTSEEVVCTLTMPTGRDLSALEFLGREGSKLAERERQGDMPPNNMRPWLAFYRRFLTLFPESVYAPEIRWRTAKVLLDQLGNKQIAEDEIPDMVNLFEQCLTFCLDRGGAYSDEFLQWDNGSHGLMELVAKYGKFDLLKRVAKELDRKHPDDEEAMLYRRVFVAGVTESVEKARRVAATLAERFPNGKYAPRVAQVLRHLERRQLRAKRSEEKGVDEP